MGSRSRSSSTPLPLCAVVGSLDIADVMAVVAIGVAQQESRAFAALRARDQPLRGGVDRADILAIHLFRRNTKGTGAPSAYQPAVVWELWVYSL